MGLSDVGTLEWVMLGMFVFMLIMAIIQFILGIAMISGDAFNALDEDPELRPLTSLLTTMFQICLSVFLMNLIGFGWTGGIFAPPSAKQVLLILMEVFGVCALIGTGICAAIMGLTSASFIALCNTVRDGCYACEQNSGENDADYIARCNSEAINDGQDCWYNTDDFATFCQDLPGLLTGATILQVVVMVLGLALLVMGCISCGAGRRDEPTVVVVTTTQ